MLTAGGEKSSGTGKLGVLGDTHGQAEFLLPALEILASQQVDAVLHCGDIGSTQIVRLLSRWPTHYVLGNCDYDRDAPKLAAAMEGLGHTLHGRFADLTLGGRRIALLHGDDTRRLLEVVEGGEFDLVCSGHTHVASCQRRGGTVVLNPGALYRANPHTIAIVDLAVMKVTPLVVS